MSQPQQNMPLHPTARAMLDALRPLANGAMSIPAAEEKALRAAVVGQQEDRELAFQLWFIHGQMLAAGAARAAEQFLSMATVCFRDILKEVAANAAAATMRSGPRKSDPLARFSQG